jgi:hypothetical protein
MIIRFVVGALSIDVLGEHTALVFRIEEYGIHVPETRLLLTVKPSTPRYEHRFITITFVQFSYVAITVLRDEVRDSHLII